MKLPFIWSAVVCAAALPLGTSTAAAQSARGTGPAQTPAVLQGFNVVLVTGNTQSGPPPDDVPPAAQRALADVKDFLPFKSYRLLDTAWMLNAASARSRIRGPEGRDLEVNLTAEETPGSGTLKVSFELSEASLGPAVSGSTDVSLRWREITAEIASVQARTDALTSQVNRAKALAGRKLVPEETMRQLDAELDAQLFTLEQLKAEQRKLSGSASIITTAFAMAVGETVVVGTSRMGGDTALIALLTAVPRARK